MHQFLLVWSTVPFNVSMHLLKWHYLKINNGANRIDLPLMPQCTTFFVPHVVSSNGPMYVNSLPKVINEKQRVNQVSVLCRGTIWMLRGLYYGYSRQTSACLIDCLAAHRNRGRRWQYFMQAGLSILSSHSVKWSVKWWVKESLMLCVWLCVRCVQERKLKSRSVNTLTG